MSVRAPGITEPLMWRPGLTQIRVHELASELNVSTHQVLAFLEDLGKKVRGPSTVIGVSVAAKVRGKFRAPKPVVADAIGISTSESNGVAVATIAPVAVTNGAHGPRSAGNTMSDHSPADGAAANGFGSHILSHSLFLPPVAPAATATVARSTGAFANPFAVPSSSATQARPTVRLSAAPAPPRGVMNRVASEAPVVTVSQPEPDYDALWQRRGIAPADREAWVAAGLRLTEAELADRCQSAGITASELSNKLSGRTALQRLRDGEATTSVWARIREAEQQPRRAGTKLTGRFQLS